MESNWILVGDMHLFVFGDMAIQGEYLLTQLSPLVDENTTLFFSGDQFDENKPVETELIQFVADHLAPILRRAKKVYMLVGNHDTHKHIDLEKNNNKLFNMLTNVTVVSELTNVEIDGYKFLMTPYKVDHNKLQEEIDAVDADILFCHSNIDKVVFDNGHSMLKNTLYAENLKKFKLVINGHIHKPQVVDNILNLGSPWQTKFGDRGSDCGIYKLNPRDLQQYFDDVALFERNKIKNTISPRFHKMPFSKLIKMSPEEVLSRFSGDNLWVTDSEDNSKVAEILKGVTLRSLRVGTAETEETGVDIDYQHNEDIMDNFSPYLKSLKKVQVGEKLVQIDEKYIKELEKTLSGL